MSPSTPIRNCIILYQMVDDLVKSDDEVGESMKEEYGYYSCTYHEAYSPDDVIMEYSVDSPRKDGDYEGKHSNETPEKLD